MRGSVQLVKGPASAVKHLQLPPKPDFQSDLCQSWGQIPVFLMFFPQAQHLLNKNNTIVRFLAIFFFPWVKHCKSWGEHWTTSIPKYSILNFLSCKWIPGRTKVNKKRAEFQLSTSTPTLCTYMAISRISRLQIHFFFLNIFLGGDMPLFYVYFLSYNTIQNIVGSHHTIYDEAWAGWRLWVESVDFSRITSHKKLWWGLGRLLF
jgi:hypothetical protein